MAQAGVHWVVATQTFFMFIPNFGDILYEKNMSLADQNDDKLEGFPK